MARRDRASGAIGIWRLDGCRADHRHSARGSLLLHPRAGAAGARVAQCARLVCAGNPYQPRPGRDHARHQQALDRRFCRRVGLSTGEPEHAAAGRLHRLVRRHVRLLLVASHPPSRRLLGAVPSSPPFAGADRGDDLVLQASARDLGRLRARGRGSLPVAGSSRSKPLYGSTASPPPASSSTIPTSSRRAG